MLVRKENRAHRVLVELLAHKETVALPVKLVLPVHKEILVYRVFRVHVAFLAAFRVQLDSREILAQEAYKERLVLAVHKVTEAYQVLRVRLGSRAT